MNWIVAQACTPGRGNGFFDFPTWYKYLDGVREHGVCSPRLNDLNDFWLIGLAIIDILLRIAVLLAIAYVLLGGFKYITSRANPDKLNGAKNTVLDGIFGLIIAVIATAVVTFIAGRFSG